MQKEKNKTIRLRKERAGRGFPSVWEEGGLFHSVYSNLIKSVYYERKH